MNFYDLVFYLLFAFVLISGVLVVASQNPVSSALFLILCFCNISCLLFFLEIEYLPLLFLIIYVGAIAVLFLFVIMMLNIKLAELKENSLHFLPIIIFFFIIFTLQINYIMCLEFYFIDYNLNDISLLSNLNYSFNATINSLYFYQKLTNIKAISFLVFNEYSFLLIISSVVLFLAMVCVIILTLNKKFLLKNQDISKQILRDFNKSFVSHN